MDAGVAVSTVITSYSIHYTKLYDAVVLRQQLLSHPQDPQLYELYARSANVAGDSVRAREAIAETYYLRGSVHEAAMQLQDLLDSEDLDYYQRSYSFV